MSVDAIEGLLVHCEPYTREEFDADRRRLLARLSSKHCVPESELPQLIREHRYEHSGEDPEDEYIQVMAFGRFAGWIA